MNRTSYDVRGGSANRSPRWFTVLIALMLALGGTGQIRPARAAAPGELVNFSMKVQNPKTTLRCGQTVSYLVQVELQKSEPFSQPTPDPRTLGAPKGLGVLNVNVEAFSVDKSVGDFVGKTTVATAVVFSDDLASLGAKFRFKANKPGKTTLHFEGLVGKEYVSTKLDVKVRPCKFKVTTVGEWHVPGPAHLFVVAVSNDAVVTAADAQSPLTGSAAVSWAAAGSGVGDCPPAVIQIGGSKVEWTGGLDEADGLTLQGSYLPAQGSVSVTCGTSGIVPVQLTPDPLQVNVASSAGVFRQSQVLQGPEATSGFVSIIVVPDDDEAAAFAPWKFGAGSDHSSSSLGALALLH